MKYIKCLFLGVLLFIVNDAIGQNKMTFSADSLFNQGNRAFANEHFDEAILLYEKARLLDPNANDIVVNLQIANEKLTTDIVELEPFFLAEWWQNVCNLMLPGGWKILSVLMLLSLLLLVYLHFFRNKLQSKNWFYSLIGSLALVFVLSILSGNKRSNQIFNSPYAIIFGDDQAIYLGPDLVSEKVKDVTGGNKIRIMDEDGEWYKVSAMDSEQGWILKENVRLIKF